MEVESLKTEDSPDAIVAKGKIFKDIFEYNFHDNEKFREGWRKVRDVIPKQKLYDSLVRAEVYFYSREVSPIDLMGYQKWLSENGKEIPNLEKLLPTEQTDTDNADKEEKSQAELENKDLKSDTNDMHRDTKFSDSEHTEEEEIIAKHPANFIELVEMIQSGMKLPETEDLNIEPLNLDPTPCDIQSPKKPWEIS